MRTLPILTAALLLLPAIATAGEPIRFRLEGELTSVTDYNTHEFAAEAVLSPQVLTYTGSPGSGMLIPLIKLDTGRLPQPAPIDIHPDGTTHWNDDAYFDAIWHITDLASGQQGAFDFWGRTRLFNNYANGQWSGSSETTTSALPMVDNPMGGWFNSPLTLGGNTYYIAGANQFDGAPPSIELAVNEKPAMPNTTPEPGTLLLAAGGLLTAAGARRWRRGRQ